MPIIIMRCISVETKDVANGKLESKVAFVPVSGGNGAFARTPHEEVSFDGLTPEYGATFKVGCQYELRLSAQG